MNKLFSIVMAILACGLIWCDSITIEPFYLSRDVQRIACGEKLVCVVTRDSLITWREGQNLSLERDVALRLPPDIWIEDILVGPDKQVWLLTDARLMIVADGKLKPLLDIEGQHLAVDRAGTLWLSTYTGMMKYVNKILYDKIDQNEHGQYHFGVSCLVLDREDYPWIGMMGPSIYRFNGKRYDNWISPPEFAPGEEGAGDEAPRPFVFDRNNHIWIPSPKGVSRFEKGAWKEYDLRSLGQEYGASEVAVDSSGRIWAHGSTLESILYFAGGKLINPVCNSPIMYVSGIRVEQMTAGPANRMFFVLSYSSGDNIGVYVYEPIL